MIYLLLLLLPLYPPRFSSLFHRKGCDDLQRLRIFDFLVNLMCTYPSAMSSILSNEELAFPSLWHALIFSPDDLISMSALTAISSFFSRDSIFEQFYPELLAIICLLPLDDSELSGTCCKPRLPLILSIVASIAPVQVSSFSVTMRFFG